MRILDEAVNVFAALGYHGATIDAVATRAGLTRAGLLHHFPSKQHLLMAVIEHQERADLEWIDQQRLKQAPLREMMVGLAKANAERRHIVQLFSTLAAESVDAGHPGHAWFAQRYVQLRAAVAQGIRKEQARGRVHPRVPAEQTASAILAISDGLQLQWLHDPTLDLPAAFDNALERLLEPNSQASDVADG